MKFRHAWKDPRHDPPPRDAHGLVVLVTITCACGKGGQVALPAGRVGAEWIIGEFEHSFEIDYWLRLPDFPAPWTSH
jgi:hypothetical protein